MNYCPVTGKVRHKSEGTAKRRSRNVSNRLRVYRCEFCGDLHITNAERDVRYADERGHRR